MDRCKQRSNRWYRLKRIKTKILAKLNAQLKDADHKITSRFISDCIKAKADTIVIGKLKGIRNRAKFSKKSNQKVHQWAFARLTSMICYKAEMAGLKVKFVSEAYTSQTCPQCGNRKKPTNRNYHCNPCGFEYHRDGVGAINLWNKVSGFILSPVVGVMASPIGVRFTPTYVNMLLSPDLSGASIACKNPKPLGLGVRQSFKSRCRVFLRNSFSPSLESSQIIIPCS